MAWQLWHIAEVEDNWVLDMVLGRGKRYPFSVSVRDAAPQLYPEKDQLINYFEEVRNLSRERLETLVEADFERQVTDEDFGQLAVRDVWAGVVTSFAWHCGQIALTKRLMEISTADVGVERPDLPEVIETARLGLRPWEPTDVEDVLAYGQDEEWAKYCRFIPSPFTRSDAEEFVAGQRLLNRTTHPAWAITLEGAVIGGINLRFDFTNGKGELGYAVARKHWSRGIGTEAAQAMMDAAFSTHVDLNRIYAMADAENVASQKVMEKVGMAKEGVLRMNRIERGQAFDEAWFGILRSDWLQRREGSHPTSVSDRFDIGHA